MQLQSHSDSRTALTALAQRIDSTSTEAADLIQKLMRCPKLLNGSGVKDFVHTS
jgi:hypothetical protein